MTDHDLPSKPPAAVPENDTLAAALARYQIVLPEAQVALLDRYCRALWAWNEKINLTRHADYEKFVSRDLIDTLELAKHLKPGEEVLDVGTGGGVPGLVLVILRPDLRVSLCDSVQKKARAVEDIAEQLGLNVQVYPVRVEGHLEDARYDALVIRAVGPLWQLLQWLSSHWNMIGRLLVIKGPKWVEEKHEASRRGQLRNLQLKQVAEYPLAGTDSSSVILKLWPKNRTEP